MALGNTLLYIFVIFASFFSFSLTEKWMHSSKLDDDGKFWIHWNVQNDDIVFKVEVRTKGYVQLGFSYRAKLDGSDVVTGWIKDGIIYFQDRHGEENELIPIDAKQDWELISGHENDTHTVLEFRKKLNSCDDDDININEDSIYLMYAFSDDDPTSPEEVPHHRGTRGSRRVRLLEPPRREVPTENLLYWDFRVENVPLTAESNSLYWCTIQKAPELPKKHHIVKFSPVIQAGHEPYVHHMLIYGCQSSVSERQKNISLSGVCSELEEDRINLKCDFVIAGFAVGMEDFVFPGNVGIPLKESPAEYYFLEVHYMLRPSQKMTDNTGMRFFYTPNLKTYDAGVLQISSMNSARLFIPPSQPNFVVAAHGHPECFGGGMKEGKIRLLTATPHAHLLARRIKLRHFRGNVELPPIFDNRNYDFNNQGCIVLREEVEYLKGDHLILECYYDSSEKNVTTYGGFTTHDEMCFVTLIYYPEIERYISFSAPTVPLVKGLLDVDMHDYIDGYYPVNYRELDQVDWSNVNIPVVQEALRYSLHDVDCAGKDGQHLLKNEKIAYPARAKPYVKEDTC